MNEQSNGIDWETLHPNYLKVSLWSWVLFYVISGIIITLLFVFIEEIQKLIPMLIIGFIYWVLLIWTIFTTRASIQRSRYQLRAHDLIYEQGWFFHRQHIIPFNRIQHLVIHINPISRKFGLVKLGIYTAAGMAKDIYIPGLLPEKADHLKQVLSMHISEEDV